MTKLLWDTAGERYFRTGIDRGVFYYDTKTIIPEELDPYEIEFVGANSNFGNTSSLVCLVPNVINADYGIAALAASSEPLTKPSGWSLLDTVTNGSLNIYLYQRFCTDFDAGSSLTWTFSGVTKVAVVVAAYRNVRNSPAFNVKASTTQSGTAHPTSSSLVTTVDNCVRLAIAADRGSPGSPSSWSWASPFDIREEASNSGGGATSITIADDLTLLPAGSVAGTTATSTNSHTGATFLILLQPKDPVLIPEQVIYDQTAIPWNGLTSIDEAHDDEENESLYLEGIKFYDLPSYEEYTSTLNAWTYPDEFIPFSGFFENENGVFADDQKVTSFHLCYRTKLGNDIHGADLGYRIHLLYNLTAAPSDTTFTTISNTITPSNFSWELSSVPMELGGFHPSSHIMIDSTQIESDLLETLEALLYGTEEESASLPTIEELYDILLEYKAIIITDAGTGVWTATGPDELIDVDGDVFTIRSNRAFYQNANEFDIWSSAE